MENGSRQVKRWKNGLVRRRYYQIGKSTMKALRVNAGRLLIGMRTAYGIGVAGQCVVKIAFGK